VQVTVLLPFFARANSLYSVSQKRFCLRFFKAPAQYRGSTRIANCQLRFGIDVRKKSANADAQKKEQDYEKIKRSTADFLAGIHVCDRIFGAS
jgi:hypothetical protein